MLVVHKDSVLYIHHMTVSVLGLVSASFVISCLQVLQWDLRMLHDHYTFTFILVLVLSVCLPLCLRLSVCLTLYMPWSVCLFDTLSLSVCLYVCMSDTLSLSV